MTGMAIMKDSSSQDCTRDEGSFPFYTLIPCLKMRVLRDEETKPPGLLQQAGRQISMSVLQEPIWDPSPPISFILFFFPVLSHSTADGAVNMTSALEMVTVREETCAASFPAAL